MVPIGFKEVKMSDWGNAVLLTVYTIALLAGLGYMTYVGNRKRDPQDSEKDSK